MDLETTDHLSNDNEDADAFDDDDDEDNLGHTAH